MPVEEDEYELIPLSPLRRMEKRMERLEKGGNANDMVKELIDVVRTNQQIVDDIVKINSDIINKINELTASMNQTVAKIDDFMGRIEVVGAIDENKPEAQQQAAPDLVEKRIEKLEKRINTLLLSSVAKSKLGMSMKPRAVAPQRPAQQF